MSELQVNPTPDDKIDFGELWVTLKTAWKLIITVTLLAAIFAAGASILMPNIYRAEVLIVPVNDDTSKSSSTLTQLGGLASLAGISISSSSSVEENLAVLQSRTFLWTFIQENSLMPILFEDAWDTARKTWKKSDIKGQPSLWDAFRLLTKGAVLSVEKDKKSDLITVAIEWKDADLAAKWANDLVARLNEFLRQQAIHRSQQNLQYLYEALGKTQVQEVRQSLFELISQEQKKTMLASTQKEFAFKVIDAASEPDKKVKPKRALMVVLAAVSGFMLSIIYVLLRRKIV
jgi:uncharacterized protein involved in exopolysaccharide biosynthesis